MRGDLADQEVADLRGQLVELGVGEVAQVTRAGDPVQQSHRCPPRPSADASVGVRPVRSGGQPARRWLGKPRGSCCDAERVVDDALLEVARRHRRDHHQLGDQADLVAGLLVVELDVECVAHGVLSSVHSVQRLTPGPGYHPFGGNLRSPYGP